MRTSIVTTPRRRRRERTRDYYGVVTACIFLLAASSAEGATFPARLPSSPAATTGTTGSSSQQQSTIQRGNGNNDNDGSKILGPSGGVGGGGGMSDDSDNDEDEIESSSSDEDLPDEEITPASSSERLNENNNNLYHVSKTAETAKKEDGEEITVQQRHNNKAVTNTNDQKDEDNITTQDDDDQSQPLQTLQKLQQMLNDTDYMTTAKHHRQQQQPAHSSSSSSSSSKVAGQQRPPDKLWTSKDRSKFKKQQLRHRKTAALLQKQREELQHQKDSIIEQQTTKGPNGASNSMEVPSPHQLPVNNHNHRKNKYASPPIHYMSSASDGDITDGGSGHDTDDGLGYTLPNLPVYYSDAEEDDDEDNNEESELASSASTSTGGRPASSNNNIAYSTTQQQQQQQQQQQNTHHLPPPQGYTAVSPPQNYYGQQQHHPSQGMPYTESLYPPDSYYQQQNQQPPHQPYKYPYPHAYHQYPYTSYGQQQYMPPPQQQQQPPPQQMPNGYVPPWTSSVTPQPYHQQQAHSPQRTTSSNFRSQQQTMVKKPISRVTPISAKRNVTAVAGISQASTVKPSPQSSDKDDRENISDAAGTSSSSSYMPAMATPISYSQQGMIVPAFYQQGLTTETTSSTTPQSLAEATSRLNFDSIQKISLLLVTTSLACYTGVSPRTLPLELYNLEFYSNLRLAALAMIAPVFEIFSVFDARMNDVNAFINTFFFSFTVGYPLTFVLEIVMTTIVRLGVLRLLEPNAFSLTPQVPVPVLPWVLRDNHYRLKRITLFVMDFCTSCVACPILEEYMKLKMLQWTVSLPRNFNWVNKISFKKNKKKKKRVAEAIVRQYPFETDVVSANQYVTQILAASLGLKLCDAGRRILLYTKPQNANKSFYAICRGIFPIQELCGTMTAIALAKRDLLGVQMPLWKMIGPAVIIHGMANFRGMKPIFKWNSATPWSEMQLSPIDLLDASTLPQLLNKGFAKLMWAVILGRVLGYCVKNYYMVNRQAIKRTTTYAGKHAAFSAELATAEALKQKK